MENKGRAQNENGDTIEIFLTVEKNDDGTITYQERRGYKQTDSAPGISIERQQATLIEIGTVSALSFWQDEGIIRALGLTYLNGNFDEATKYTIRFTPNDILIGRTTSSLKSFREMFPDAKLTILGNDKEVYVACPPFRRASEEYLWLKGLGTLSYFIKATKADDDTIESLIEEYYTFDSDENVST